LRASFRVDEEGRGGSTSLASCRLMYLFYLSHIF
jgi:hypothetical protein